MEKELFVNLITSKNISEKLLNKNNLIKLLEIVPEISDMIGFEHKNPQHHLDVWNHTVLAMQNSEPNYDIRLALLLHDIGKPHSYQDKKVRHFRDHPKVSETISKNVLANLNENSKFTNEILFLVKNHDSLIKLAYVEDKDLEIYFKLLKMQYCDAKAHHPDKVEFRIKNLDRIKENMQIRMKNCKL